MSSDNEYVTFCKNLLRDEIKKCLKDSCFTVHDELKHMSLDIQYPPSVQITVENKTPNEGYRRQPVPFREILDLETRIRNALAQYLPRCFSLCEKNTYQNHVVIGFILERLPLLPESNATSLIEDLAEENKKED